MTELGESDVDAQLGQELADLCRKLIAYDKVSFEETGQIRNWLAKKGQQLPAAKELQNIASRIRKPKSKKEQNEKQEELQGAIEEFLNCCHKYLRVASKHMLDERTGAKAVCMAILFKYLMLGLLGSVVFFGVIVNVIVWSMTESWLVPLPIGEETVKTVDNGVVYLILAIVASIAAALNLASREYKSFQRDFIQVQVLERKRRAMDSRGSLLDPDFADGIETIENYGWNFKWTLIRWKKYYGKRDSKEAIRIPASVGKRFRHNQTVVCGVTKNLLNGRTKFWGPFEPI